ncbi:hypothetical protein KUL10_31220 [Glaciecola sp. KUL10]|nr:hypothetical protein KUL10_31220 [Glaciecola sp. KUL10]
MLALGVLDPAMLQNLRTIKPEMLCQHYAQGEHAEPHPSPDRALIDAFCDEATTRNLSIEPRALEAKMLNRLIAELSKLAKKHVQYSPDLINDKPKFDDVNDYESINLLNELSAFKNFARRAERNVNVKNNEHLRLQICVAEFTKSKFKEVGKSGAQQYNTTLKLLLSIFGNDKLVTDFCGKDVIKFKNTILNIKSGRKDNGVEQTLGVKSVVKYLSNARQFFEWLIEVPKYIDTNPLKGVSIKLKEKHQKKRRKFEHEEIHKIVTYEIKSKKEAKKIRNAAKWFAIIALYTGMRLNEIASLTLRDIKHAEGIDYIDLTLYNGKSDNAPRIIPMHSKLIERGFLHYVDEMRKAGESRLFPELALTSATAKRDGPGSQVGNWFNDTMLAKIGIDKKAELDAGRLVDFHSARHTVVSRFKYQGVDGYIVKQLLGHEQEKDITWGTYSGREGTKLSVLKKVIESLDY